MKLVEVIERVKAEKPNMYSEEVLTKWLNQIEMTMQSEVMERTGTEIVKYSWKDDGDTELLIPEPYDEAYLHYVKAMIDYNNKEFISYNFNSQQFNAVYKAFAGWYKRQYGTTEGRKTLRITNYW